MQTKINELSGRASGKAAPAARIKEGRQARRRSLQRRTTPPGFRPTSPAASGSRRGCSTSPWSPSTCPVRWSKCAVSTRCAARPSTSTATCSWMRRFQRPSPAGSRSSPSWLTPFFRKNGKTVIPLKVGGTRGNAPQFGLDVKKALTRDTPEAPARKMCRRPPPQEIAAPTKPRSLRQAHSCRPAFTPRLAEQRAGAAGFREQDWTSPMAIRNAASR